LLELPDLGNSLTDTRLIARRATLIKEHIDAHKPDRVLVDYLPLGLGAELVEALTGSHPPCLFCWGMPYPGISKTAPRNPRIRKALARYRVAFVYTCPGWLDPVDSYREYGLPECIHHVGVVVPEPLSPGPAAGREEAPLIVGLAGAGVGAEAIFRLLLEAVAPLACQGKARLRLVAGLYHEAADLVAQAQGLPGVEVLTEGGAEECARDASVVVARCGYNTAFSLANTELPLIFCPWPSPDPAYTEQFDRARALATLPGIWWIDERSPLAAAELGKTLELALARGRRPRQLPFATEGAARTAELLLSRPC
jgi:predicted glycosyltransferase